MNKKFFRLSVVLTTVAAMAVIASPFGVAQAATPTNIRIFVGLGTGTDPDQITAENALAKEWNDANSDIQIKFDVNSYDTAHDLLLTQVAGGNAPDIVGPVGISGLGQSGDLWADLSSYITKDKAALNLTDYDASTLNLYQLQGKDIALPLGIYPSFLMVNKDIFTQAQLALPPTDYNNGKPQYQGKLWDRAALRDLAIKATQDKAGHYADEKAFDPTNTAIYGFGDVDIDMRGFAQEFSPPDNGVKADGKTADFNNPTYVQAFQWLHDGIYKDHFFPDGSTQNTLSQGGNANSFASGILAMYVGHTWALGSLKDVKFKWVAAVPPVAPNGKLTSRIDADTFSILDKSKNKDAAWKVLKWLTSAQTQTKLCSIYGCLPARNSARADWEKQTKVDFPNLDLNVIYGAIKYLDSPNYDAYMPNYNQAFDFTTTFWTAVASTPDMDVKAELDKFNTQMQAIFDGKVPTSTPAPTPIPTAAATTAS